MLRSVFAIAFVMACHPAPAPTLARAAPQAAPPIAQTSPVRQDFDFQLASYGPLAETITTGHGPCETPAPRGPILFVATGVDPCRKTAGRHGM